ncbi:MAG: hypothetical protein AAGI11_10950 [Pseudomonadota bacterium]
MSIGAWEPDAALPALDEALLVRLIAYSRTEQLDQLETLLAPGEAGLMKLDHTQWQAAADGLGDDDIVHLIRVLTVAENLSGWEAGQDSPVIPLARSLRKRGQRLQKDLLLWIREHSENRYLPYGPLL